jgi:hypothetical protein
MVKAMQGDGLKWGENYRPLARQALAGLPAKLWPRSSKGAWPRRLTGDRTVSALTTSPTAATATTGANC